MMATAAGASVLPSNGSEKPKRTNHAREFKLTLVNHYYENNISCQISKRFLFNTKTILR